MSIVIEQSLEIDASLDLVWQVLTDCDRYGEWNPFVVACQSTLKVGDPIFMRVKVLPFLAQPQRETIWENIPKQKLSYGIVLPLNALRSVREHELSALDATHTRYRSRFHLSGWQAPLVALLLESQLRRGFAEMSAAIKQRAEALQRQSAQVSAIYT